MCGIVGYIGDGKVGNVLLKGLSRLEYRGYDSAGIATLEEDKISIHKQAGKLRNLSEVVLANPVEGRMGIGHTRWATHGEPSQANAHPHSDCTGSIAVVHNGIVENHAALKDLLIAQGHVFQSDTDTEVLCHLVENYHLKEKMPLEESVRRALKQIEGCYAFCVMSTREPDKFIAARNGSPLVVGVGEGRNLVASDAPALLDYTRNVIFLEDYQMAVISRDNVRVTNVNGEDVPNLVTKIEWDAKDVSKEGFEHFMLKEIEEQPKVLDALVRKRVGKIAEKRVFDVLRFDEETLRKTERVIIQACGTSWHAALTAKFLFEKLAGIPTEVDVSSELRYRTLVPLKNTLVLSITQSGETVDTLMGLRKGRDMGYKTISICNVLGSTIARESDGVIYTQAGPEIGVASTKAYTAQLGVLVALSLYWGQIRETLSSHVYEELVHDFQGIPAKMSAIIAGKEKIRKIAEKYFRARDFLFLGRGINYPNAHEGALKIKEIAYIHATGHPAGEMKHGPIALIDQDMPVVCIAPHSPVYEKMFSNIQEVKARKGRVIAIANPGDTKLAQISDDVIEIPACSEILSPLLVALPLQYLAYYVAVLRGTDVDQPRNLAKSVTVE
ncbi:MAG TPA: glutamine--fructose-6-phosphate transaminase (isomerizing) [Verrucomicrobiae bacterium]|nr:glutamine--fructose-6-phosphate transaminase (isomerizing) [Verrucomicrobiae bacterium]